MTLPYMQKIVSDYLRAHASVTPSRIVAESPENTETPWVHVRQLDGNDAGRLRVETLIDFMFQFDCYVGKGEGTPQAFAYGHEVRDALKGMGGTVQGGANISNVEITGDLPMLDTDLTPGRWRKIITATIHAR